jgi:hypothetical protein
MHLLAEKRFFAPAFAPAFKRQQRSQKIGIVMIITRISIAQMALGARTARFAKVLVDKGKCR